MGNWGYKTFESDDALDFIGNIMEEHGEENAKDDFLFKNIKSTLKEIPGQKYLDYENSVYIEVSAYIFSELLNYDEKKIKKGFKELEIEIEEECEGGFKLDLSKSISEIINQVEEKDGYIPTDMYIDLCLYKNKNYKILESFLYRLLRQLNNILSGNSESYELWENSSETDFNNWLLNIKNIFKILKSGLSDENNLKNIKKKEKNISKTKINSKKKIAITRDGLTGFKYFNGEGKLLRIELIKYDNNSELPEEEIEEVYKNEKIDYRFTSKQGKLIKSEYFKDGKLLKEKKFEVFSYTEKKKLGEKIPEFKSKVLKDKFFDIIKN